MKVDISYDDFLTEDNRQIINNADVKVNNNITINLSKRFEKDVKVCEFKISDDIGINEMRTFFTKDDLRKLIEVIKRFHNEL